MPKAFYKAETYDSQHSIGYLVRRLNTLMLPRAEAQFADAELTFSQWVVLKCLGEGNAATCAELSRYMNHDTGATTRLIDQLEARGFVTRTRSTADRRVVNLKLLPAGKAMAKRLAPRLMNFWNRMLTDFTAAEAATLIDLLTRLSDRVEKEPVEPIPAKETRA